MIERKEKLFVNNFSAEEIKEKYGTPLYVYDRETIEKQYEKLEEEFSKRYNNFSVSYAVKANPNPSIAEVLVEKGAGLDCASMAEIDLALKLDVTSEKIIYTTPFNTEEELEYAVSKDVTVNLDAVYLLDKMSETPERVSFRIDPGIGKGDFGLVLGGGSKFGISEEEAIKGYKKAKERGVERFGIHMMTGSGILDPEYFGEAAAKLLEIAGKIKEETGIEFEFIDIGGGLGIPYRPEEKALDIEETAEKTVEKFKQGLDKHGLESPELRIEPGRYLVAQSGILLSKVVGVKQKQKEFIGIDTGMNHFIRPMLYDAYHEVLVANDLERETGSKKDVVGQVCENTDVVAEERELPELVEDDLVAIMDVGAYGFAMASNWNTRPKPPEVLVDGSELKLIREGQERRDVFHGTELE